MATRRMVLTVTTMALSWALIAVAGAQQPRPGAPTEPRPGPAADPKDAGNKMSGPDRRFIRDAAAGGMAEVELGKLAQQKATNDQVKQFAQRMIDDHGKANQQLMQLAQAKGVEPGPPKSSKHQRLYGRLSKLEGAEFDRQYVKEMVKDHQQDVAEFRRMSQRADDPELKAWAASTLPTLEEHLQQIRGIQEAMRTGPRTQAEKPVGASGSK
jgi:putative membrane protein